MDTQMKPTWLGYLNNLKGKIYEPEQLQLTDFDDFVNANTIASSFFRHSVPAVYLLDYRTSSYINMSENFAGYKSEYFIRGGISHTLEIFDRDHLKVYNERIFPDRLQILKNITPLEHKNYVFSYNFKLKNRNGNYDSFLQRSCFLSDANGSPLFSMGILLNITNYNNGNSIVQTVDKISANGWEQETEFKKVYFLNEEDKLLSMREREVLLWMAEGLSNKMIADKMSLSEHTVINHRRNMHTKTNMPNATALVGFAIRNGLI
uniref:response regulator transcription factor n=1 Tax=Pedobacter schmidteae TaxID=2201271 RepID=UPI000EB22A9A|nr:helix-turn-helix transcriptional regulator [Pedobacter schmidteae]